MHKSILLKIYVPHERIHYIETSFREDMVYFYHLIFGFMCTSISYIVDVKLDQIYHYFKQIKIFKHIIQILCSSYNLCDLLGPNTTDCAPQLKSQNLPCHCPFQPGTYTLQPATFKIPELSGVWSWLASVSIYIKITSIAFTKLLFQSLCVNLKRKYTCPSKKYNWTTVRKRLKISSLIYCLSFLPGEINKNKKIFLTGILMWNFHTCSPFGSTLDVFHSREWKKFGHKSFMKHRNILCESNGNDNKRQKTDDFYVSNLNITSYLNRMCQCL